MEDWVLDEFGGKDCGDLRLNQRFVKVALSMNTNPANSIYSSQKEPAELKAAYRLLTNDKLSEEKIFLSHQEWLTKELKIRKPNILLNIQDTSTLDYSHLHLESGFLPISRNQHDDSPVHGLFLHQSILCSTHRDPLGMSYDEFFVNSAKPKAKGRHKTQPIESKDAYFL